MKHVIFAALSLLLFASAALADEAKPAEPSPAIFAFTKEQTETIAQTVVQKRNEAAAEYTKWNDLLMDIQKQAGLLQKKADDAKAAASQEAPKP